MKIHFFRDNKLHFAMNRDTSQAEASLMLDDNQEMHFIRHKKKIVS